MSEAGSPFELAPQGIATAATVPLMLGCCIHILLTGNIISMMSRFIMTGRFHREPIWMRVVVCVAFVLNFVQLGISFADVIYYAANQDRDYDHFFSGTKMDSLTPWLTGWIAIIVQGVYGWRAWSLFKTPWRKYVFAALLVPTMLVAFLGSMAVTVINIGYTTGKFDSLGLLQFDTMTSMWLWASVVVDVGLSTTLWFLFRGNMAGFNERMDFVLLKLATLAIQSGSYTALVALLGAIFSEVFTSDYTIAISYLFLLILPAVYTISLFVSLGAKQSLNETLRGSGGAVISGQLPTFIPAASLQTRSRLSTTPQTINKANESKLELAPSRSQV